MGDFLDHVHPTIASSQLLLSDATIEPLVRQRALTLASLKAASSGLTDYLEWLLLKSGVSIDLDAVDEDGSPALCLAACFGHGLVVQLLIEAGANPAAVDRSGWAALHWAAQNADVQLASYLVNHQAPLHVKSFKGLQPIDLIRHDRTGDLLREMLLAADEARCNAANTKPTLASPAIIKPEMETIRKRVDMAYESARQLDIDLGALGLTPLINATPQTMSEGAFDWETCLPDEMLIFAAQDLSILLDLAITETKPTRPLTSRCVPANVLFYSIRFAAHCDSIDLLDNLVFGAIERIEDAVNAKSDDLGLCTFWLCNTLTLLYYLRTDQALIDAHSHGPFHLHKYQSCLSDLVNLLCTWINRDVEKRLDKMIDGAILDYEAMPGFEDLRFEGEWRIIKAFSNTGSVKSRKESSASLATGRRSVTSLFSSSPNPKDTLRMPSMMSPKKNQNNLLKRQSMTNLRSPPQASSNTLSPKTVTNLFDSALYILQLYEIHPIFIIQCLSQIFYWLACELTNRVLSRRKYLCRSKAIQIRLNVSHFEEWARINKLPPKIVSMHFAPFNQLLQWLQCLSSEETIDGLVGTMQNLSLLNPLQLRRAAKDYRYEVDESKMSDECFDYLVQVERDWEKQRMSKSAEQAAHEADGDTSIVLHSSFVSSDSVEGVQSEEEEAVVIEETKRQSEARTYLDNLLNEADGLHTYQPAKAPDCLGDLLDSRYMLPFAVPSNPDHLIAFGHGPVFGPLWVDRTPIVSASMSSNSTPGSKDGTPTLSVPTEATRNRRFTPFLPEQFLKTFDAARSTPAHTHESYETMFVSGTHGLGLDMSTSSVTSVESIEVIRQFHDWRARLSAFESDMENAS